MNGSGSGQESRSTEQALGTIADETNVLFKQMQKGTLINRISILDILLSGQDNCTCGAPSYLWVIERPVAGGENSSAQIPLCIKMAIEPRMDANAHEWEGHCRLPIFGELDFQGLEPFLPIGNQQSEMPPEEVREE